MPGALLVPLWLGLPGVRVPTPALGVVFVSRPRLIGSRKRGHGLGRAVARLARLALLVRHNALPYGRLPLYGRVSLPLVRVVFLPLPFHQLHSSNRVR